MKKLLPKSLRNPQGFTLIELMIAIAIVAILATIGLAIFTGTQKNARDTRRRADVDAVANALESHYLALAGTCDAQSSASTQPTYCPLRNSWFTANALPTDPLGSGTRPYCINWNNTSTVIADPATWTNACPTGWTALAQDIPAPGTNFNAWKVCAAIEGQIAVVCKGSQQL